MSFDLDRCWCYNSMKENKDYCDNTKCFRHIANKVSISTPDIFTIASCKNTKDCPYFKQGEK